MSEDITKYKHSPFFLLSFFKKFPLLISNMSSVVSSYRLSGRVLDSRPRRRGFEPHRRHCVVSLSKNINPSLLLDQPRKTRLFITEIFLMGRKESNQTKTSSYIFF